MSLSAIFAVCTKGQVMLRWNTIKGIQVEDNTLPASSRWQITHLREFISVSLCYGHWYNREIKWTRRIADDIVALLCSLQTLRAPLESNARRGSKSADASSKVAHPIITKIINPDGFFTFVKNESFLSEVFCPARLID